MAAVEAEYPNVTLAVVADILGYKNPGSLERTLYRSGHREIVHRLKPGTRKIEDIRSLATSPHSLNAKADRDHPWLSEQAIPVNKARTNVQHNRSNRSKRRKTA